MNEPPIPPSGIKPPVIDWEAKYKELERATTSTLNTSHGQRSFGDYVNGYCKQLDLADRVADLEAKNKEKPSGHPNYQKELLERIAELEEKLKTAKHYAENLSDKLNEAEETLKKYGTRSEVYIRAMEHKLTLLDQLKQADIEIAKASFDYYPKF
jgi:predicted RNase H-like nuclease (RuvC/YqgF family)